eukprot:m.20358 g.20358  ORF g.20358 m.20358 type:complete len:64 (+) comp3523_c0_seq2:1752-1943(+)
MGRLRRKRIHKNIKDIKKKYRTRRKTKDIRPACSCAVRSVSLVYFLDSPHSCVALAHVLGQDP